MATLGSACFLAVGHRPALRRAMPEISDLRRNSAKNVIRGALRVACGVNHKAPIIAKLLQPAGDVRDLIVDDRRRYSRLGTKVSCSHFGDELLTAIFRRAKRSGLKNRGARESLLVAGAVDHLMVAGRVVFFG